MDPHSQHCYICHAYFIDRVKLGIHISACYTAHKDARPELPRPEELLLDDRRYTEYVKNAVLQHQKEMELAQKRNVSYVTMNEFDDVKRQLAKPAGKPSNQQRNNNSNLQQQQQQRPVTTSGEIGAAVRQKIPDHRSAGGRIIGKPRDDDDAVPRPNLTARPISSDEQIRPSRQQQQQHQQHTAMQELRYQPQHQPTVPQAVPVQQQQQPTPTTSNPSTSLTGITMLRNELTNELAKVRALREEEERRIAALRGNEEGLDNNNVMHQPHSPPSSPNTNNKRSSQQQLPPLVDSNHSPGGDRKAHVQFTSPIPSSASPSSRPASSHHNHTPVVGSHPGGPTHHVDYHHAPGSAHDEQHECPKCGRSFGKKGYSVHVLRCGMHATEDFTWSKDKRYEREHQRLLQEVQQGSPSKVSGQSEYGGEYQGQQDGGREDAHWTQFMTTYPRPVLDEKPKTAQERARAAQSAKERQALLQQGEGGGAGGGGGGGEEPRVPCGRCGRMFVQSRVRTHEGVCISSPHRYY